MAAMSKAANEMMRVFFLADFFLMLKVGCWKVELMVKKDFLKL